jgi:hypothetical protein
MPSTRKQQIKPQQPITRVGKDAEALELSYTASGNPKWHKHFAKQLGGSLKQLNCYHMTQNFTLGTQEK